MQRLTYAALLAWSVTRRAPGRRTTLMAVDGHGGSGKSTFAARLAEHEGVSVVHTDDFANLGVTAGLDVSRLLEEVVVPLTQHRPARYRRFDSRAGRWAGWQRVPAGGVVVVEGVSVLRSELTPYWDATVWVDAPMEVCLRRGLERDDPEQEPQWQMWLREEDEYIAREDPRSRAQLVVAGAPQEPHDPDREFVVLADRRARDV